MRLINTTTLELHEFIDASNAPYYAILSHRWETDEVSFVDYQDGQKRDSAGYKKIVECCKFARQRGREWVWIDTCCIDKRSSAELTEAINSMFSWYTGADICYAHLSDVESAGKPRDDISFGRRKHQEAASTTTARQFERSKWFTRGWTLQELIAPREVVFVCRDWTILGYKRPVAAYSADEHCLNEKISAITGIPQAVLQRPITVFRTSVAQRMSWAANRTTTRVEDMTYCLLGVFDINMPLLYGEGRKAFVRLQAEIMARYDDESIFTWSAWDNMDEPAVGSGMLAALPAGFTDTGRIIKAGLHTRPPYALTNRGVEIRVSAGPSSGAFRRQSDPTWVYLALNCSRPDPNNADLLHKALPCAVTMIQYPCGHYGRQVTGPMNVWLGDPNPEDWLPFDEDEVLYVHRSSADALNCSIQERFV